MRLIKTFSMMLAASLSVVPAKAEVLRMTSLYPAADEVANLSHSVAVSRFLGSYGDDWERAVRKQLRDVKVDGAPYFEMSFYNGQEGSVDALITGAADVDITEADTKGFKRTCVEYDATKVFSGEEKEAECVKHETVETKCIKRTITLEARLLFVSASSGTQEFERDYSRSVNETNCPLIDDSGFSSERGEIQKMAHELSLVVRNTLAPTERNEKIRVLERRKGMEKTQAKAFKAAVRMTKKDAAEACRMWSDQGQNSPGHLSLAYNIALCSEQAGDFTTAQNLYRDAQDRFGQNKNLTSAIRRIGSKITAKNAWEARQAALTR